MKRYRTIVADPPWCYTLKPGSRFAGQNPAHYLARIAEGNYPTMSNQQIADLDVASLAESDAHLYLWTTNPILTRQRWGKPDPVDICHAWGFQPKTILTWVKTGPLGMGSFFRGNTEHVIFAVRGRLPIPPDVREKNVFTAPRGKHSQKPEAFLDLVERVSPGPFLELFARRNRLGWDTWGDEAFQHVAL